MKPPTPSHPTHEEPFIRSQAPPPESQLTWDLGSTQSTERTKPPASQTTGFVSGFSEGMRAPSKTAETILGVLGSGTTSAGKEEYKWTMEKVRDQEKGMTTTFLFDKTSEEKPDGTGFGEQNGREVGAVKPAFGSDMTKPFALSTGSGTMGKTSGLGQGSPFPVITSAAKAFGSGSTFTSSTKPSVFARKGESKPALPPKPVQQPLPKAEPPTSKNRFSEFNAASSKQEVITIDSDDDMVDDQNDSEDDGMVDDVQEERPAAEQDQEMEEENQSDEDANMLDSEDDARDKDYVVEEEAQEEEEEDEPIEEEVAKEVEELVKESPERKERETKPLSFDSKLSSSGEVSKWKEPEMSEIKPPPPVVTLPPSEKIDDKTPFRFGLPTTPSTFKPLAPITDTPSSALRKEFKFGLPSTSQKEPLKPAEKSTEKRSGEEEPPRRVTRSSSPTKRPTVEEKSTSPVKRQRSTSPAKKALEDAKDMIQVKEPLKPAPFVFGSKLNPGAQPFTFGSTDTKTSSTTKSSDMFSIVASSVGTTDRKPTFSLPTTIAEGGETGKPTFSLGPTTTKDADSTKQAFSFGAAAPSTEKKDFTWTPDKPIKFDTPPQSMTSGAKTLPFTFGQSSATISPFKFGGLSTPVPSASSPKFGSFGSPSSGFGSAFTGQNVAFTSPNLGFSFGQSPSASTIKSAESTDKSTEQPTGAEPTEVQDEDEPPVVSAEVGNEGEEDEETVFSERAKLIQRLSNKERQKEIEMKGKKPDEVKMDRDYGVGVVRVNIHKETKKGRILFRLEGSGRVILVSLPYLQSQLLEIRS